MGLEVMMRKQELSEKKRPVFFSLKKKSASYTIVRKFNWILSFRFPGNDLSINPN